MKVIDLLNKIANGEEVPKKIKYKGHVYNYQYKDIREANIINYYHSEETHHHLIDGGYHDIRLNDEVEIIEEDKKIEKIKIINNGNANAYAIYSADGTKCALTKHSKVMCDKINEIIDKINEMSDKE